MGENWAEQAEEIALDLFSKMDSNSESARLLEISPTNRTIVGDEQASVLATLRYASLYYRALYQGEPDKYKHLDDLCDIVEQYTLTLDGEQNSRRQFIKVQMAKMAAMFAKQHKIENMEDIVG